MSALGDALVHYAIEIANDNRYHYVNWNAGETNRGPWSYDCATFNSLTIYKAMGWDDWINPAHGGIGYFWPSIADEVYGSFNFLIANGWHKERYNSMLLTPGAIIVTDSRLGHSLMYLGIVDGVESLADANDFGQTDFGPNSIAVRPFPYYAPDNFYYIFLPPDVPVPPIPGHTSNFLLLYYYLKRKRRKRRI